MFTRAKPSPLQDAYTKALSELDKTQTGSEEYATILESVIKLHKMLEEDKPDQVSMDTAAVIAANILGILLIIRHEHVNVITSKAMGQVMRPR